MGFSNQTVISLMTLVDEHKEGISEATYVEICNALKFLHDKKKLEDEVRRVQASRPRPVVAAVAAAAAVAPPPAASTPSMPTQNRTALLMSRLNGRFSPQFVTDLIRSIGGVNRSAPVPIPHPAPASGPHQYTEEQLVRYIASYQSMIDNIQPRVTNQVKMTVLHAKCTEMRLLAPMISGHTYSNQLVKETQDMLVANGVSLATLKAAYQIQKRVVADEEKARLTRRIERLQRLLDARRTRN